jgi:cytochrome c oxidase subunit 2
MDSNIPLFPEQASSIAGQVDALYFFLIAISVFFGFLIYGTVTYFAIRYRRRHAAEVGADIHGSTSLEILWTAIPFLIAMVIFAWGTVVYFKMHRPPSDTLDVFVVGKQWMWKIQHTQGKREINNLHVPVGQAVKLTMTSEDVIHDFFIPAFRVKMDVLPGRYTSVWFKPTKVGEYHLFCAEYCGTKHAGMKGTVTVMERADYQKWLAGGGDDEPLDVAGGKLFEQYRCNTCHLQEASGRGPSLIDLFGKDVELANGRKIVADEAYIRESIINPGARTVAGYKLLMPTFQGQISETGILQIMAYIKSLQKEEVEESDE